MTSADTNGALRTWMVAALGCALEPRSAVYVSTPITTGKRFLEWRTGDGADLDPASTSYRTAHLTVVVAGNREHVAPLVRDLRKRFDQPVMDPTVLEDVPGWEQFDYHRFWTDVITRYVDTVVFVDGWEYSSGCAHELAAALESGVTVLTERLEPLAPADAAALLRRAADDLSAAQLPTDALEDALASVADAHRRTGPMLE